MIRGHQFNKVEMFQYTRPEDSEAAFQELVDKAIALVEGLGLHFKSVSWLRGLALPWEEPMTSKYGFPV